MIGRPTCGRARVAALVTLTLLTALAGGAAAQEAKVSIKAPVVVQAGTYLAVLHLNVTDRARSVKFYTETFDMQVQLTLERGEMTETLLKLEARRSAKFARAGLAVRSIRSASFAIQMAG